MKVLVYFVSIFSLVAAFQTQFSVADDTPEIAKARKELRNRETHTNIARTLLLNLKDEQAIAREKTKKYAGSVFIGMVSYPISVFPLTAATIYSGHFKEGQLEESAEGLEDSYKRELVAEMKARIDLDTAIRQEKQSQELVDSTVEYLNQLIDRFNIQPPTQQVQVIVNPKVSDQGFGAAKDPREIDLKIEVSPNGVSCDLNNHSCIGSSSGSAGGATGSEQKAE